MFVLDWNDLSSKHKKHIDSKSENVFIVGPVDISNKRIKKLLNDYNEVDIIFGCLKDNHIPGLEGSPHFKPLRFDKLFSIIENTGNCLILKHFHRDIKHAISEIGFSEVVFTNGSWQGPLHYKAEYWNALKSNANIRVISPFCNKQKAKKYSERYEKKNAKKLENMIDLDKEYTNEQLLKLSNKVSTASWDWLGQTAGILTKNGKILEYAWNRVVPFEAYQMHHGSLREQKHIPSQKMLETHYTNHFEMELLEKARRKNIDISGATLVSNLFPCPICAKALSRTNIAEIIYSQDHNHEYSFGYKALEASGIKLKRIVI